MLSQDAGKRPAAMRLPSFKGKEKAKAPAPPGEHWSPNIPERPQVTTDSGIDDRMWVDIYEPTTEAELAVHVRKVDDVRKWLQDAFEGGAEGKLKKYRVRLHTSWLR